MRAGRFVACAAVLLCGSCASQQQVDLVPAYGQAAGYYPGRAEPFFSRNPALTAWLSQHQQGIDDVQRRVAEMREGKRAPACIGEDKYTCVAALAQKMAIADNYALKDLNVFAETKYDVNGRPVTGSKIIFDGYAPGAKGDPIHDHTAFTLALAPQGTVVSIEAMLPKDAILARTQEQYDATRIYETVAAVTATTCPMLSRADIAKWIENTVKPNFKLTQDPGRKRKRTSFEFDTNKIAFCGRMFAFQSASGTIRHGFQHDNYDAMTIEIQ